MGRLQDIRKAIAECFEVNKEPLTKAQVLTWIGSRYPTAGFNLNTLQAQLYRSCVNSKAKTSAPKILWYERSNKTYRYLLPTDSIDSGQSRNDEAESDEEIESQGGSTFAVEAHLRDYLARNLATLEKGLSLWSESPPSVEYSLDGRRIDILGRDVSGLPVVIEMKLSRGHEKVIGQALLYRGLLKKHLNVPRVRIMLIASEITRELKTASSELADVELFEYVLTMQLNRLNSGTS
jgi:endonuclease